ncbi:MAG: hypothetical protein II806_03800 [Bacteroidaceae bacterium]|jgi:hypothetical protein|nr:hypothetical protein [Bacteroidaceae bacterium]
MRSVVALLALAFVMLFASCGNATPEEMASLAAKGYYDHLLRGEYQQFLEGKAGSDSLPDDYREQLLTAYKQFMAQQEKLHHGIREIRIANAKTDTIEKYTNVFLVLCFGDSTNEEVVVPMREFEGRWRMK